MPLPSLLRHLQLSLTPLLSAIIPYTAGTTIKQGLKSASSEYPAPSYPLPIDTPLPVSLALEFFADALIEQGHMNDAAVIFAELSHQYDRMRAGYWEYRRRQCNQ